MSVKEDLKIDILERYNNAEYHDSELVEEYVKGTNPEIVALEKDIILDYLPKDSKIYNSVKEMEVEDKIVLKDAGELAEALETGVVLVDENGNKYYYGFGSYNQYRIIDVGCTDCRPINKEWSVANGSMKFTIINGNKDSDDKDEEQNVVKPKGMIIHHENLGVNFNGYPLENIDGEEIASKLSDQSLVRLHKNIDYDLVVAVVESKKPFKLDNLELEALIHGKVQGPNWHKYKVKMDKVVRRGETNVVHNVDDCAYIKKYKQLPLTGEQNDYTNSLDELKGTTDLHKAIVKFYEENKDVNPRQLHYIVNVESNEIELNTLLGVC